MCGVCQGSGWRRQIKRDVRAVGISAAYDPTRNYARATYSDELVPCACPKGQQRRRRSAEVDEGAPA